MIVDLRSDVLTKPTKEMIDAMLEASFGDDVFSEDECTNKLEEKVARLTGKEAAIFVVSGTMANQLAIASQSQQHDEIILDLKSHIFQFEQGAPAVISGVQLRPADFEAGLPDPDSIEKLMRFPDAHHPRSRMLCLEVTHNALGGLIPDFETLQKVSKKASSLGLSVHIDGARIWNACIASGRQISEYGSLCDTMMFCFSKGLGTPVGSVLVGSKETIEKARYIRKGLGGGWRQPGMLAAAANYALDNNAKRLAKDHARARRIADAIESHPRLKLTRSVHTNMVFFTAEDGLLERYSNILTEAGILHDWKHFNMIRLVTYLNIDDEMIDYVVEKIGALPR